ncbi:MAG: winged helix-turn-helix transcriptional regulator [Chloroflexi bacterium]|nr:winged helix-turn-helix transcriptional regulator [Chloroflexota bacterium]
MDGSRLEILRIINERPNCTVTAIAESLGLAPISVRYHLNLLERDGCISTKKVRGAVGRPFNTYSITNTGREQLPHSYDLLAERVLDQVKQFASPQQIETMFRGMAESITAERAQQLHNATVQQKIDTLVQLLGAEGFLTRWEQANGDLVLKEYNCPYQRVRQAHPEICQLDKQIISSVMKAPVELDTCIADGDECCTYHVMSSTLINPIEKN